MSDREFEKSLENGMEKYDKALETLAGADVKAYLNGVLILEGKSITGEEATNGRNNSNSE